MLCFFPFHVDELLTGVLSTSLETDKETLKVEEAGSTSEILLRKIKGEVIL